MFPHAVSRFVASPVKLPKNAVIQADLTGLSLKDQRGTESLIPAVSHHDDPSACLLPCESTIVEGVALCNQYSSRQYAPFTCHEITYKACDAQGFGQQPKGFCASPLISVQ